ncbi:MAG: hypothetical protein ACI945_000766, partial [Pseudohongiellaceae bacterium]
EAKFDRFFRLNFRLCYTLAPRYALKNIGYCFANTASTFALAVVKVPGYG